MLHLQLLNLILISHLVRCKPLPASWRMLKEARTGTHSANLPLLPSHLLLRLPLLRLVQVLPLSTLSTWMRSLLQKTLLLRGLSSLSRRKNRKWCCDILFLHGTNHHIGMISNCLSELQLFSSYHAIFNRCTMFCNPLILLCAWVDHYSQVQSDIFIFLWLICKFIKLLSWILNYG